jgi:CRISPR-associated protein Cmr4
MDTVVLGLFAETFLHPGSGSTLGVVDLPVAREAATSYPFVPGSGLKGALRAWWEERDAGEADGEMATGEGGPTASKLFGRTDAAGSLRVSDARLALLPVRSLDGPYAWTTCPHVLERLQRDLRRSGIGERLPSAGAVQAGAVAVMDHAMRDDPMVLEERSFTRVRADLDDTARVLGTLIGEPASQRVGGQLAVLSDEDFAWFARFGLAVQARNVLDDNSKQSKNLWYEETLPPDSLLWALVGSSEPRDLDAFAARLLDCPYLQLGGNETVGQGWVHVVVLRAEGGER